LKILIENHVTSTDASLLWQTLSHTLLITIRNNRDFLCIAFDATICLASLADVVLTVSDHDEWLICRAFRSKPFLLFLMLTNLSAWIDSHVSIIRQIIRQSRNASRQILTCLQMCAFVSRFAFAVSTFHLYTQKLFAIPLTYISSLFLKLIVFVDHIFVKTNMFIAMLSYHFASNRRNVLRNINQHKPRNNKMSSIQTSIFVRSIVTRS